MKKAVDKSFVSDFGFESPNFSVDKQGNITANSVNLTSQDTQTEQEVYDFTVTDNGANFIFLSQSDTTPTLNLEKGKEYSFDLKLVNFTWNLKRQDQETDYIEQITHSSGETGSSALNKGDGIFRIEIPADYDESTIFYTDFDQNVFGTINVVDPIGVFSTVEVTDSRTAETLSSAPAIIAGGLSVSKNIIVGDNISVIGAVSTDSISSNNILTVDSQNRIDVNIAGNLVGDIDSQGSSIPVKNTNIDNTNINNSAIGQTLPNVAAFTTATVNDVEDNDKSITNKKYVDTRDIVFSIAFGL